MRLIELFNVTSDKPNLKQYLYNNNFLFDFSYLNCACGSHFSIVKDSGFIDGECWKCANYLCRKKISIRSGSWFEQARFDQVYDKVLLLTYCWANSYSNILAAHECGVHENSIVHWFNFCREVCIEILEGQEYSQIGGEGVEVEIDESKFGKRKYHRGRKVDGVWVFGGIEKYNKENCFFVVVEQRSSDVLIPLIEKYIRPGSIITSDCWKSYDCLKNKNYTHEKVNHSEHFVDPDSGACTNHIENSWTCIKRMKLKSGFAKTPIATYFAEFIFRRKFLSVSVFLYRKIRLACKRRFVGCAQGLV